LTIDQLLKKIESTRSQPKVDEFAKFLKEKIDKEKDIHNLIAYSQMIDIDKDGRISKSDLQTCILNKHSVQFYKNGG